MLSDPIVREATRTHLSMQAFPGHLPRGGGIEDQDALLLAALSIFRVEVDDIREAFEARAAERPDGRRRSPTTS